MVKILLCESETHDDESNNNNLLKFNKQIKGKTGVVFSEEMFRKLWIKKSDMRKTSRWLWVFGDHDKLRFLSYERKQQQQKKTQAEDGKSVYSC